MRESAAQVVIVALFRRHSLSVTCVVKCPVFRGVPWDGEAHDSFPAGLGVELMSGLDVSAPSSCQVRIRDPVPRPHGPGAHASRNAEAIQGALYPSEGPCNILHLLHTSTISSRISGPDRPCIAQSAPTNAHHLADDPRCQHRRCHHPAVSAAFVRPCSI